MPPVSSANDMQSNLHWALNTAPPFHIVEGPYRNQGFCDGLMQAVEKTLPDRHYSQALMPQTRIGVLFERDFNQCFPCMVHRPNSDDQRVYMSEPTHTYQPHGIITRPDIAEQLTAQFGDPLVLQQLLESNEYRLGHPAGRQYGTLQSLLDLHEGDNSYRVVRTGEHATVAILDMIHAGRVDYTIDYKPLVTFYERTEQRPLAFIEIAETEGQLVHGAIGCTNNVWGRSVIQDINQHMDTIRRHPDFVHGLSLWFEEGAQFDVDANTH